MRQTNAKSVLTVTAGALFAVVVLVGVIFYAGIFTTRAGYVVSVYVSNARGIATDSTVFEAGLPVGLVSAVRRNGPDAILTLRITSGVRPLPVDSHVQLGLRSLAGEADVLLFPGHSRQTVLDRGSLGLSQDESYTEVDQILNVLNGPTEAKTRQLVQSLGEAVNGEGANINATLGAAADFVNKSPVLTSTLAAQHTQVVQIVANLDTIMSAISQRDTALGAFARGALATFATIAARNRRFGQLLAVLPATLTTSHELIRAVNRTSGVISPVLRRLGSTLTAYRPALALLIPGARSGTSVLTALGHAAPQLRGLLARLTALKPAAVTALPALHALTCQLDPMLAFAKPYGPVISAFAEDWGGGLDAYGTGAHQMLASMSVDPSDLIKGVLAQPNAAVLSTLLNFGLFSKTGAGDGYHALPIPFSAANNDTAGTGLFTTRQWGADHPYPHITARC
jgi:phospholipid/cholesterol/gamma-HCH transport system substrate-binding protein